MTTTVDDTTRNGVDTATLFATRDAVKAMPAAAKFQFRAHNTWLSGTHSRSTVYGFFGVGEERTHEREFHGAGAALALVAGHLDLRHVACSPDLALGAASGELVEHDLAQPRGL